MKMTSIFTKVKPGDLITSDLFNQITDKIEEMQEITSVMEVKKNSEANASEPDKLSIKGNLGIGTKESPSEKLEVNGTVKTGNDGQFLVLKGLKSSDENPKNAMSLDFTTSSQGRISPSIPTASFRAIDDNKYFSSHLGFFTNEASQDQNKLTERLRITSNGKVGIGTTEPSEKLEVNGTVKANKFLGDGSGLSGIKTGQWKDIPDGISYTAGKVGIGTSNPTAAKLEVNLEGEGWNGLLNALRITSPDPNFSMDLRTHIIGGGNVGYSFRTTKDALTIDTNGNVGIGTTNPTTTLEVNGNMDIIGSVSIGTSSPSDKLDVQGDAYFGAGKNNENHKIVIRGPNQPSGPNSFQDLSYEFATAGSVKIRAYTGCPTITIEN